MQAIILAAGMGKRLKELTAHQAKCMVNVNGISLIERMLRQLEELSLSRIVLVIGHEGENLKRFIQDLHIETQIVFLENDVYFKTNNIYSLYLAKEYLQTEDTLLLESDLIFEKEILRTILDNPEPSLALVAKFESWMDGTVAILNERNEIEKFLTRKDFRFEDIHKYYKTVNIYKFSKEFSKTRYVPFLEAYSEALGNNAYYEQVLKVISLLDEQSIKACRLENGFWYEIDDEQDLDIAESIFTDSRSRLECLQKRYGGYWRYPHLLDFCYLVNPYFPNQKLLDEMKANFERLVTAYPSGIEVNNLLAAKSFGIKKEQVLIGNGAAELIKALLEELGGCIGIVYPSFEEYGHRAQEIIAYEPKENHFSYGAEDLMAFYGDKPIQSLLLINPDNPSGNYVEKEEVIRLAMWTKERNIRFLVDESFVDFADRKEEVSLLDSGILEEYPNLLVVKSISKSYGVPGFRLGIIASGDRELLKKVQARVSIWNINSFGEYFLQIFEKYKGEYREALEKFYKVRKDFYEELKGIHQIRLYPSEANYIMCEVLDGCSATKLTEILLNRYDILIKDLSSKRGMDGRNFIRFAIRTPEENHRLLEALKGVLR